MTFVTRTLAVSAWIIAAGALVAQTTFEVASVKPSGTGYRGIVRGENGTFRALGATFKMLVAAAYGVPEFQVEGGPSWVGTERWDIDARTGSEESLAGPKAEAPLKELLEQRFKLVASKQQKLGNVFFLDLAKSGLKMKPSSDSGRPMIGAGNGIIGSNNVTTSLLVGFLTRYLGRTVIDRTGLTATYEVHITWTPDVGEGDPLLAGAQLPPEARLEQRSLFAALEEDLGLKLTSAKQDLPTVNIISVERPDPN